MITLAIYFCVKLGLLQLYPTYISYKAIKVNDQAQFQSLLTFWVVSITYLAAEYFSDIFLFWIPFYTLIKLIIILWLILPQTQGAAMFYTHVLDPFLQQHEQEIDKTILDIQAKLKQTIVLYGKQTINFIKKSIFGFIKGHESTVDQSSLSEPEPEPETSSNIISPYHLFSTLVAATANRIQQQQKTESQESLQSYVDIKDTNSTEVKTATWGEYLSSWVKRPAAVSEEKKSN